MILKSKFKPAIGLSNPHLQTLLPTFLHRSRKVDYIHEILELDDGDYLDLAWTELNDNNKPIVIVFHGLEGSVDSPYVKGLMMAIRARGWKAVLMHFRGCSGRINRLPRSYHSGETSDAKELINFLSQRYPDSQQAAVGFSLGGNMLLKLLSEIRDESALKAAVSVCAPLVLNSCANRLDKGLSKIYQKHLISSMKKNLRIKAEKHNYKQLINLGSSQIKALKNFRQFDHLVTAPLHGFDGVDDYYTQSSSRQYIKNIQTPSLIIQTLDDPFMSVDVIPDESELSEFTQLEISDSGGHVGFISGHLFKPVFWLEQRIPEFLSSYLRLNLKTENQ